MKKTKTAKLKMVSENAIQLGSEQPDLNTCFSTVQSMSWELADDVVHDMLHALFWHTLQWRCLSNCFTEMS